MSTTADNPLLHHIRRLAAGRAGAPRDGDLLEAFRQRRDETAFAALVERHGPMVLGVCQAGFGGETTTRGAPPCRPIAGQPEQPAAVGRAAADRRGPSGAGARRWRRRRPRVAAPVGLLWPPAWQRRRGWWTGRRPPEAGPERP